MEVGTASLASNVLVEVSSVDPKATRRAQHHFHVHRAGRTYLTASGVVLPACHQTLTGRLLVLCGGSTVQPFLQHTAALRADVGVRVQSNNGTWHEAEFVRVGELLPVRQAVERLTRGSPLWYQGHGRVQRREQSGDTAHNVSNPLSSASLALLSIARVEDVDVSVWSGESSLRVGQSVWVVSSAYAGLCPVSLRNGVSRGVVSNAVGAHLALTDARCLAGSEGGAVLNDRGDLVGMVTLPLRRHDSSTVELNLFIPAQSIRSWLRRGVRRAAAEPPLSREIDAPVYTTHVRRAMRSVVAVKVQGYWASGVVLSRDGYVLTNAHLLRPLLEGSKGSTPSSVPSLSVRLGSPHDAGSDKMRSNEWFPASLVYQSDNAWDVALLKVECGFPLTPAAMSSCTPRPGQGCMAVGHALFQPGIALSPFVTHGSVSRVVSHDRSPVLLQSSAAVHTGNSGGLLADERGDMLGLVCANLKHSEEDESCPAQHHTPSVIIPHINFAIPSYVLRRLQRACAEGAGVHAACQDLAQPVPSVVSDVWNMRDPAYTPPEQAPIPPKRARLFQRIQQEARSRL